MNNISYPGKCPHNKNTSLNSYNCDICKDFIKKDYNSCGEITHIICNRPEYPKKSNLIEAVEWMDTNKDREYRALSPYGSEVFRYHSGFATLDSGNNPIKYDITIGDIKGTWKLLQPKEEEGKDVYKEFAELLGKWCEQMQEFNEKIQNKR